jgi:hypothetical protein
MYHTFININRTREETGTIPEGPPRPTDQGTWGGHTEDRNVVGETIGGYRRPTWWWDE